MKKSEMLKNSVIVLLTIFIVGGSSGWIYAQKDAKEKTITIKKIDGKKTIVDTTFVLKAGEDLNEKLKEIGCCEGKNLTEKIKCCEGGIDSKTKHIKCIKKSGKAIKVIKIETDGEDENTEIEIENIDFDFDFDFDISDVDIPEIEKTVSKDGTVTLKVTTNDENNENAKHKIMVLTTTKSGDCESFEFKTNFNSDEENVLIEKTDDGSFSIIKGNGIVTIIGKMIIEDIDEKDIEKLENDGINTDKLTGFKELELDEIKFYPNPSKGVFKLKFNAKENSDTKIRVIDISGKIIYEENLQDFSGQYEKQIDLSSENSGIYFLQIIQGKKAITKQLVITE